MGASHAALLTQDWRGGFFRWLARPTWGQSQTCG